MRRLTTPTHTWELPFLTSTLCKIKIIYSQHGKVILEKYKEDCKLGDYTVTVELSQEDTKLFDGGEQVQMQLRGTTINGKAFATDIVKRFCGDVLDNEVL